MIEKPISPMAGHSKSDPPFWIHDRDKSGRAIESELIDAAQRTWKRVLSSTRREIHDRPRAGEILEGVVHSVSNAMRRNLVAQPIKDIDAYLFWAFSRRLNRISARERLIKYVGGIEDLEAIQKNRYADWARRSQSELQLDQLMGCVDERTRRLLVKRMSGYSWNNIARSLGITRNAAEVQFSRGIAKARRQIFGDPHSKLKAVHH